MSYRAAVGAAVNWGEVVRAAMDLHRREVYEKLGLRAPTDFAYERRLAWQLTQALLVGSHLPNDVAAAPSEPNPYSNPQQSTGGSLDAG